MNLKRGQSTVIGGYVVLRGRGKHETYHVRENGGGTKPKMFTVAPHPLFAKTGVWKVSWSCSGRQNRRHIRAVGVDDAIRYAERIIYGVSRQVQELTVAEVLKVWFEQLPVQAPKTARDNRAGNERFMTWCIDEVIPLWGDVQHSDFQRYANGLGHLSYNYARNLLAPIRAASKFAVRQWPSRFADNMHGVKVASKPVAEIQDEPSAITLLHGAAWLLWLRKQPKADRIFPAAVLQVVCGMRVEEAHAAEWEWFDFERGTLDILKAKNKWSLRRIPLPGLAVELLRPIAGVGPIVPLFELSDSYGKRVRAWLKAMGIEIKAGNLRDVLTTEARRHTFEGYALRRYLGHAPEGIEERHYVNLSVAELVVLMRAEVVSKVDKLLEPITARVRAERRNVIELGG